LHSDSFWIYKELVEDYLMLDLFEDLLEDSPEDSLETSVVDLEEGLPED
jgi:hypothetical protein